MENKIDAINLQIIILRSMCKKYKTKKEKDSIRREIKFLRNKKTRLVRTENTF
jgi:hypothetical protein